jgi:hypothetical protein
MPRPMSTRHGSPVVSVGTPWVAYDPAVLVPEEVISYLETCREEGINLQRGMNLAAAVGLASF